MIVTSFTFLPENSLPYKVMSKTLIDQKLLDRLHWDSKKKVRAACRVLTSFLSNEGKPLHVLLARKAPSPYLGNPCVLLSRVGLYTSSIYSRPDMSLTFCVWKG